MAHSLALAVAECKGRERCVVSDSSNAYTPSMPLEDREILLGKIALGRALLARPDAIQAAQAKAKAEASGRPESLSQTLVRLGLLAPSQVRELERVIDERLVACSKCNVSFPLRGLSRAGAERCASCEGRPLFILPAGQRTTQTGSGTILTLDAVALDPSEGSSESEVQGGSTFLDLSVEEAGEASSSDLSAEVAEESAGDFRSERTMEFDAPDFSSGAGQSAGVEGPAGSLGGTNAPTGDFRTERTMEIDAPDFNDPAFAGPGGAPDEASDSPEDFRTERTMEFDAPDFSDPSFGGAPAPASASTPAPTSASDETPEFQVERTMELEPMDFGTTPGAASSAAAEDSEFQVERTMELEPMDFGTTPGAASSEAAEDSEFQVERTMELEPMDFGTTPGAASSEAAEDSEFQVERTMELEPVDFGATPGASSPEAEDSEFQAERTLELDAPNFGGSSFGAPGEGGVDFGVTPGGAGGQDFERTMELGAQDFAPVGELVDVGATTALPPGWVQEVSAALPEGEATQELDADAVSDFQREAFEPFSVGEGIQIMAPVARGGMGVVFRGQRPDGQVLAVKILVDAASKSPEILERFRREAVLAHGLEHPSIVRFHGAGIVSGGSYDQMPYFAMDYVAGRDLSAWARERTREPLEAAKILAPLCGALHYAHGLGVVHRDLKPANVLVRAADDAPFLCDFGLAKLRSEAKALTQTGDLLGTPSYMAPEQARGQGKLIGPPTDVHALGALLYFLLSGRAPFVGPKPFEVLRQVVQDAPRRIDELNPAVPAALAEIVHRALQKSPQDRFHTAGDLQEALEAL